MSVAEASVISRPSVSRVRRSLVLVLIGAVLVAAIVGNATVKRRRAANQSGVQAAVAFVHPSGRAQSTAWFCPGPLPVGLKKVSSHLMIANAATRSITGQMLVATTIQGSFASSITVPAESTLDVALPQAAHSAFAAVSLLTSGSGIGVEEITDSPTGRMAAPCVAQAASQQFIPVGSTKAENDVTLSLYDPGATPSVANVSFATTAGTVSPQALQGLPIGAGQLVVLNVAQDVAQTDVVSTMVHSTGGELVAGAIESANVGTVAYPSLVTASGLGQANWLLPAVPAGGNTVNLIYVLNPGSVATTATVSITQSPSGQGGTAVATLHVPAGGVARLAQGPAEASSTLRFAAIAAKPSPVIVGEASLLEHAIIAPVVSKSKVPAADAAAGSSGLGVEGLPASVPLGYAATSASVPSAGWMITGGALTPNLGEFITVANPTKSAAVISLSTLAAGLADTVPQCGALVLAAGEALSVDLGKVLPNASTLTVLVHASAGVIAGASLYSRGSSGSRGLSEPVAIPLD